MDARLVCDGLAFGAMWRPWTPIGWSGGAIWEVFGGLTPPGGSSLRYGGGRIEFSARLGLARLGSENGLWLGSARLGSPRLGAGSARLARRRLARVCLNPC